MLLKGVRYRPGSNIFGAPFCTKHAVPVASDGLHNNQVCAIKMSILCNITLSLKFSSYHSANVKIGFGNIAHSWDSGLSRLYSSSSVRVPSADKIPLNALTRLRNFYVEWQQRLAFV